MRRYRALFRPPGPFCAGQSWADCITNTAGSDFRQGHLGGSALFLHSAAWVHRRDRPRHHRPGGGAPVKLSPGSWPGLFVRRPHAVMRAKSRCPPARAFDVVCGRTREPRAEPAHPKPFSRRTLLWASIHPAGKDISTHKNSEQITAKARFGSEDVILDRGTKPTWTMLAASMQTKQSPDEIASSAENNAGKSRTLHTQTHSPEACRRKAQECVERSEKLTDPKQKAAMLQYAEWWTRLAEIRDSPSVLLGRPDSDF